MNIELSYLIGPLSGSVIGYFTNWLAIKMMFRPHQPKYIFGQAISGGSFYDAAKMQALELVRAELAANITTDITTLVNIQLENQQLSAEKASSASKIMEKGKALVSQKLYSTIPLIEIYRQNPEGNVEVQIRLAYDKEEAVKVGVNALKAELEKEGIEF